MSSVNSVSGEKKFHYAFVIFIGCCCLCAGSYGAILSTVAVYLLPVISALGCGAGDWMLWMTLFSIVGFLSMQVWGKLVNTKNFNVVSTSAAIIVLVAQLMFAFGGSVTWYWVWGSVLGAALACVGALIPPTLINNWFDKSVSGKYLGIAAACSGFGAFVFAPLFTQFIQMFGYQITYMINVAISAVLMLPFTVFLFKYKPADKGLAPYGQKAGESSQEANAAEMSGMTKKEAMHTATFYLFIVMIVCLSLVYGFNSNMVAMASDLLSSSIADPAALAMLGATMVSAASIGNVASKVLFGFASDKLGIKATVLIFAGLHVAAFVFWVLFPSMQMLLIAGAALFGCNAALVNVGMPILVRSAFGDKEYAPIYATISSFNALLAGVSATVIGFAYQLLGSYQAAIIAGIVVLAIYIVCFIAVSGSLSKKTA